MKPLIYKASEMVHAAGALGVRCDVYCVTEGDNDSAIAAQAYARTPRRAQGRARCIAAILNALDAMPVRVHASLTTIFQFDETE